MRRAYLDRFSVARAEALYPSSTWPRFDALYNEAITDDMYIGVCMGMDSFNDMFGKSLPRNDGKAIDDTTFTERFPRVAKLLTWTVDDAGVVRKVCTLTLVCEDGVVKAGLRERDHGLSLWVSSETVLGVFAALEEALCARPVDWRKLPEKWKGR